MADQYPVASSIFDAPIDPRFAKPGPRAKLTSTAKAAAQAAAPVGIVPAAYVAGAGSTADAEAQAAEERAQRIADEPGPLVKIGAAMSGGTTARVIRGVGRLFADSEYDRVAVPGYQISKEDALKASSEDDLQELLGTRSDQERDAVKMRQADDAERNKVIFHGGMASGLMYSLGSELIDPINLATGWAGARYAAAQHLTTATKLGVIGQAVKINLIEGVGVEASLQLLEKRYDPANLGIAAGLGIALGGAFGALEAPRVQALRQAQTALEDGLVREAAMLERARSAVGPAASKEQVELEYRRLRTEEIAEPVRGSLAPTGDSRKLMEHPDEVAAKAEAEQAPEVTPTAADRGPVAEAAVESDRFVTTEDVRAIYGDRAVQHFEDAAVLQRRVAAAMTEGGAFDKPIQQITGGQFRNYSELTDLPRGITVTKQAQAEVSLRPAIGILTDLAAEFLPKRARVIFGAEVTSPRERGVIASVGDTHVIGIAKPTTLGERGIVARSTIHEIGHAIAYEWLRKAPPDMLDRINKDFIEFANLAAEGNPDALAKRFSITAPAAQADVLKTTPYHMERHEWMAEQFVKYIEKRMVEGDYGKASKGTIQSIIDGLRNLVDFFTKAKQRKLLDPDASMVEFFEAIRNRTIANTAAVRKAIEDTAPTAAMTAPTKVASTDPIAVKYGLTSLPQGTTAEKAQAKALINLYTKADAWATQHPMDEAWTKRADNLIDNSLFSAASTGLTMLKSKNPVVRMVASELLEDGSGVAAKRHSTAAISKYTHERLFMGNAINDVQGAYSLWGKQFGNTVKDDYLGGGELRARFDKEVASEIENRRRSGNSLTQDLNVKAAADSLESAYERIRKAQIDNKTLGWAAMPGTSVGYMPHQISPNKWLEASNAQRRVVHDALTEQFVNIEGWTPDFSSELAAKYLQRVQARATGGHDSPIGGSSAGSAEIVEDALLSMGMARQEVFENMKRFNRGAAGWTKKRLDLDLNRKYDTPEGSFRLLDIFNTDQLALLRGQAGRASGEVGLARHGVYGRPGLQTLREAMTYGGDAARGTQAELQAFDQVSAEFLNAPFGDAGPKWMERARLLNSVVRLGGIVYNQAAEFSNALAHVGVVRTLSAIGSMPRLRKEVKALAKGEKIDNPVLGSIEQLGGAEFGTDAYKIVLPFDTPDHAYPTYGKDTMGVADKLLRGASYAQSKLSLWRAMHSVQERGMAEQIVAKIARYVRDGKDDIALDQFGVTPEVRASLKADLGKVARWDGDSLVEFDITKMTDPARQEDLIHAVHRGVKQIIQGTYIGETGKWAHDGYLKALTQFRTFSLTSMEKQWARQRNSRGVAHALGIMLGSMSVVLPVYMARTYASSIGRPDRDEYIAKRMAPELVARQMLNYIAMSGLSGDFLDLGASIIPDEYGVRMTGGRAGTDSQFVGNVVAPSLSLVDDIWKAMQNLDDPEKLARILPGSRLPFLLPAVNALGD